jgi:hypothetical protein
MIQPNAFSIASLSIALIPRAAQFVIKSVQLVAVFCLVSGLALAEADNNDNEGDNDRNVGSCTRTADAALRACQHEIEDNFWIAIGNCINLSDPGARTKCDSGAKVVLKEGEEECGAQSKARLQVCKALGEAPYDPPIDPSMFVDPAQIGKTVVPNPYFPLVRGRTWVYKGDTETTTVTVTEDTKMILGVTCAILHDVVEDNGEVIEDTKDKYAQDIDGNVWYFGEISQQFEDGELVSIEGSWTAGVDSAKAGIIMKAAPAVGDVYRQEFSLGNAEDIGEVLSLTGSATVPAAACNGNCLVTKDFTPLEPDVSEHKYYAPGVGLILEVDPGTGDREELVEIKN